MIKKQCLESVIHPYALLDHSCVSQAFSTATSRVFLAYRQAPRFRQQVVFSPPFPTCLAQPAGQGHVLLVSTGEVEDAQCCMSPARPHVLLSTDVHLRSKQPREGTPGKNAEQRAARQGGMVHARGVTLPFLRAKTASNRFLCKCNNQPGILRCP